MARKGPSPQKLKMDAYRARPYTDAQRMNYETCECDGGVPLPPPWVRDTAADRALDGGYVPVVRRGPRKGQSNICDQHFVVRSANGTCSGCLGDYA